MAVSHRFDCIALMIEVKIYPYDTSHYLFKLVRRFLGEPNNGEYNEDCLEMKYVTARLNDQNCRGRADGYVCETAKRAYMNG